MISAKPFLNQMELCYVPPGPFWMGSGPEDRTAAPSERPQHQREVDAGYWISRFAISASQFRSVGVIDTYQRRSSRPIVEINWHEAVLYCEALTQHWYKENILPANWAIRLPTEIEWEKAARGGFQVPVTPIIAPPATAIKFNDPAHGSAIALKDNPHPKRRYPWGNQPSARQDRFNEADGSALATLFMAGATPYGCEDMAGNIWEWCLNKAQPNYENYKTEIELSGEEARVVRGGAFDRLQRFARCSFRYWHDSRFRFEMMGFRVVLAQNEQP